MSASPSRPSAPPRGSPRPPGPRLPRLDSLKNPQPRPRPRKQKKRPDRCINPDCTSPATLIIEDAKLVCESCGTVADDSPDLVTDLQYGLEGGRHVVHGHHVGADSGYARNADVFDRNRQVTSLEHSNMAGKGYAIQICSALQISPTLQEAGMQVFRLASSINFIQGRRTKAVAAVSLYIACRSQRENPNHYMLIDFADVLQINVFSLGSIYTDLVKELRLNPNGMVIREINPEDLVLRFAQRLEFGSETMRVANDAVRIVQRMNRDWMTPGRRPAGIVGAALIIASRMNNFRRTAREMVYVAKVNEMTILKRLEEFKVLESSGLTIDEFRTIELENSADPPAFYQKKKPGRKPKHVEFDDDGDDFGDSPTPIRAVSDVPSTPATDQEAAPANMRRARADRRRMPPPPPPPPPPVPIDPDLLSDSAQPADGSSSQSGTDDGSRALSVDVETAGSTQLDEAGSSRTRQASSPNAGSLTDQKPKPTAKRKRGRASKVTDAENPAEEAALTAALTDPFTLDPDALQSAIELTAMSEPADATTPPPTQQTPGREIPISTTLGEDEFEDDPEVQNCLLGPDEVEMKTRIWTSVNADWIRHQAAKKMKHDMAVANGTYKPRKTRQRKRQRMGDLRQYADEMGEGWEERLENGEGLADTAAEAVGIMMKRRAYSNKINYEALKDVYTPSTSTSRRTSIVGAGSPGDGIAADGVTSPGGTQMGDDETSEAIPSGGADGDVQPQESLNAVDEPEIAATDDGNEDEEEDDDDYYGDGGHDDNPDDPYDAAGDISDS